MTTINIKIVGYEGDSVLIKYATDKSLRSIDDYEAVAFQPKNMGYDNVNDFLNGIKDSLLAACAVRDKVERTSDSLDLSSWVGETKTHSKTFINPNAEQMSNILVDSTAEVKI